MSIEKSLFLRVMGSFASGVTIITVIGRDGQPHGLTASAVTSLSLEPRMLLICVNERFSTLDEIKSAGTFAINILATEQQDTAQQFATRKGDRFGGVRWRPGPETGAPVLDGSLAYAECRLRDTCKGGDHVIVMAENRGR